MAVTPYCTDFELDLIWSEFGMLSRMDGNNDGVEDAGGRARLIEEASVRVNHYLLARYTVAVLLASPFVRDATAYIAAFLASKRRGMSPAEGLVAEYQWYIEQLTAIRDGHTLLTGESGLASPRFDNRPAVSNFTVDGRYRRSKVRKVQATSTDVTTGDGTKTNPALDYLTGGFNQ